LQNQAEIWVVGEVLVDLINGAPIIGGGPANTAKALARLGERVEFIGGLSSDRYGHMAWMELASDGVGVDLSLESDKKSAMAIVEVEGDGSARYQFQLEESATFDFSQSWLPKPDGVKVLHIGTLATLVEPGASELFAWVSEMLGQREGVAIIFDPNVRPAVSSDRKLYREKVEAWVALSSVVKASDQDIAWLYPDWSESEAVKSWQDMGPELVVVTKGSDGAIAYCGDESLSVSAPTIQVVDTVGAGDTFGAVITRALKEYGANNLKGDLLYEVLELAVKAASITCMRAGAKPPTLAELESF
jgi:fructokinase